MCYAESERGAFSPFTRSGGCGGSLHLSAALARCGDALGRPLLGLHGEPNARDLNMQEGMR